MRIDLKEGGEHTITLTFPSPKKRPSNYSGFYYIYGGQCEGEQSSFIADEELHQSIQNQGAGQGTTFRLWSESKENPDTGKFKMFYHAEKVGSASAQQGQPSGNGGSYDSGDRTLNIELQCMTKCASWLVAAMITGSGSHGSPDEEAQTVKDMAERLFFGYKDQLKEMEMVKDAEQPHTERPADPEPAQDQRPASDSSEDDPDMFGDNADVFDDLGAVPF